MSQILIVEDEVVIRSALRRLLEKNGFIVEEASSVDEAVDSFNFKRFDLLISDLRLPGTSSGTDLIKLAHPVPVLIMTSYASLRSAVDAMKLGAVDYIAKPFNHEDMLASINSILAAYLPEPNTKTDQLAKTASENNFFGQCSEMQRLFKQIKKVAITDTTVLIRGESGTGKELAAREIHRQSSRNQVHMISVNCAAIPDALIESELFGHEKGAFTGAVSSRNGLLEAANGGTLFLDEIGELPLEAQARLLRFLQEGEIRRVGSVHSKKVDVRLIAATHRDLKKMASEGLFREDLYYRLYVMELCIPPLRERGNDIIEIAEKLLGLTCSKLQQPEFNFDAGALHTMQHYTWPGNVRELENAIERAVILADSPIVTAELLGLAVPDLPDENPSNTVPELGDLSLDHYFKQMVLKYQGELNETELAQKLGISRKCLWERRQKIGLPRKK